MVCWRHEAPQRRSFYLSFVFDRCAGAPPSKTGKERKRNLCGLGQRRSLTHEDPLRETSCQNRFYLLVLACVSRGLRMWSVTVFARNPGRSPRSTKGEDRRRQTGSACPPTAVDFFIGLLFYLVARVSRPGGPQP